jgi:hypothetical protein
VQFLTDSPDCALDAGGVEQYVHRKLDQSPVESLDGVLVSVRWLLSYLGIGHRDVEVGVVDLNRRMWGAGDDERDFLTLPGWHVLE